MRSVRPRRPRTGGCARGAGTWSCSGAPLPGLVAAVRLGDGRRARAGRRRGGRGATPAAAARALLPGRRTRRAACSQACLTRARRAAHRAARRRARGARLPGGAARGAHRRRAAGAHPGRVGRLGPREAGAGAGRGARPRVRGPGRGRGAARSHADPPRRAPRARRARRPPAAADATCAGCPPRSRGPSRPSPASSRCRCARSRTSPRSQPSPEARARLLGAPLEGGIRFAPGRGARALVRRRLEQVHGEVRVAAAPFELVEIDGHPGIALWRQRDAWLGRALVLNAPLGRLAAVLGGAGSEVPEFLRVAPPPRRRAAVQLRAAARGAARGDGRPADAGRRGAGEARSASRSTIEERGPETGRPDGQPGDRRRRRPRRGPRPAGAGGARAAALLGAPHRPGGRGAAARAGTTSSPSATRQGSGGGWPTEVEIRVPARAPVFALPREELAGLGPEGDLLLGWQAGDTIAAALPKPALG